ncbi:MAG TPA: hydantoinase [Gammaproteobacteria bacterium]|nr:hydantoinase [Gammaproteobacteria bacterium]
MEINVQLSEPLLGVDTGGTFTDFVLFDGESMRMHKVLSTPYAPEEAILQGIREMGLEQQSFRMVHGSTVATNAALEGKGVATLYISNRGFGDLLTIGRQARSELYNLQPQQLDPPVAKEWCHETGGRLSPQGDVLEELSETDLEKMQQVVATLKPESIAVNLLFSWVDDRFEQQIRKNLPDDLFISLSSEILPEIREYERGIATWLNAWIGPLVDGYLKRLQQQLPQAAISIMQSSGDTIDASQAGGQAVHMLLSGPAGGLVGASYLGRLAGRKQLLTFDMGGTSTDVALIDGEPQLTSEGHIAHWPVAVSMVDMHTIGAGGGSIAWLDAGGMLHIGPQSAGADPGPACYGKGGAVVTVTDANLVLGRLRADAFLGGRMQLDSNAAHTAMQQLAESMQCTTEDAARGVITVANEQMVQALRKISIERGADPQAYTLVSFGGAGGLHVCALAELLGVSEAMVPVHAGVLSALGMLTTRPGRQLSRTWQGELLQREDAHIDAAFKQLATEAVKALQSEGVVASQLEFERTLDLRYKGQSYTLNIGWSGVHSSAAEFHETHQSRYGHRLDVPVEMLNLRLRVRGDAHDVAIEKPAVEKAAVPQKMIKAAGEPSDVPLYQRDELAVGQQLSGPAVVVETISTTWVAAGWRCTVDVDGNLMLCMGSNNRQSY